jgi:hypothetical protein
MTEREVPDKFKEGNKRSTHLPFLLDEDAALSQFLLALITFRPSSLHIDDASCCTLQSKNSGDYIFYIYTGPKPSHLPKLHTTLIGRGASSSVFLAN